MRTGSRGTIVSAGELVECFGRNGTKWNGGRSLILVSRTTVGLRPNPVVFNGRVVREAYIQTKQIIGYSVPKTRNQPNFVLAKICASCSGREFSQARDRFSPHFIARIPRGGDQNLLYLFMMIHTHIFASNCSEGRDHCFAD